LAVTAKFLADFSAFQAAVQKAEVSLRSFESGAGKVEKSLNRMADGFSGVRVIQEANLAAEAIERIGGVTKLTEKEQDKLNATVSEAIAKYKALGIEAPQAVLDLANATAKVPEKLSLIDRGMNALRGTFGQVFGAFTAANLIDRAVTSVVNFGKEAVRAAGDTIDLANKTGLTTDTIQRMGYVAKQTGTEVSAFTNAAFMLGVNLEKGKGQVEGLGVSFAELRALKPDAQFDEVVRRLESMDDATQRNEAGVRLFGRSFKDVAAAIADGYTKMADKAVVAKSEQLKALDEASDAWEAFVQNTKSSVTGWLGEQVIAWKRMHSLTDEQTKKLIELQFQGVSTGEALKQLFPKKEDVNLPIEGAAKKARKSLEELEEEAKKAQDAAKKLADEAADLAKRVVDADKAHFNLGLTLRRLTIDVTDTVKAHRQQLSVIPPLVEQYTYLTKAMADTRTGTERLRDSLKSAAEAQGGQFKSAAEETRRMLELAKKAMDDQKFSVDALAKAMTDLAQTANVGLISGLATLVNGINVGTKAVDELKKGFDAITSGGGLSSILKGFTGIVGGIGGLVSAAQAAISIGKALFNIFDRDKGRDLVEDFVQQFGGFDGIQKIFAEMGEEGHRLWVMLTQGVGRNNPDQARRAIEEVTAAIERFKAQAGSIPTVTLHVNTIETRESQSYESGIDPENSFAGGSGGFRNFGSGTPAMLHGWEAVVRPQDLAGAGQSIVIPVYVGGRQIDEVVVDAMSRQYRSRHKVSAA
jgi:tetratricopeptide (TPR) repeat protein